MSIKKLYTQRNPNPLPEKIETQKNNYAVSKPFAHQLYIMLSRLAFVRLVAWATKSIFSRGVSRIRERNDDRRGDGSKLFVRDGMRSPHIANNAMQKPANIIAKTLCPSAYLSQKNNRFLTPEFYSQIFLVGDEGYLEIHRLKHQR